MPFWFLKRIKVRPKKAPQKEYLLFKEAARNLIHERLEHFNQFYGFSYQKVFIKNTKTKWGSCSSRSNLNFHYKTLFLPQELQDYLIVHELCHLQEMNHGPRFWELVAKTIPDYAARRRKLRMQNMLYLNHETYAKRDMAKAVARPQ